MGLLSTVTNGLGRTLTFTHNTGKLASVSDGTGRSIAFTLDMDGNLSEVEDPDSKVTTFTYAAPGLLESIFKPANPMDPIVTNSYDSLNRVMEQTDAYSNLWQYFLAGSRSEEVDPEDNSEVLYLNNVGKVTKRIDRAGKTWLADYDGLHRVIRTEAPEGNATEFEYDSNHNVLTVTGKAKPGSGLSDIVNEFTYDPDWNKVATATDALTRTTTYTYDNTTGQLLTVERPVIDMQTPTVTFTYNGRGQVETVEDETGIVTEYGYDSTTEKLESVVHDVGGLDLTTLLDHNSRGDVISITDRRGYETTFDFDVMRRLTQVVLPAPFGFEINFTYDENGNRLTVERETGDMMNPWQITETTYYIDNLVKELIDPGNQATEFVYNSKRQLWKTEDAASQIVERTYDPLGRLLTIVDQATNTSSTRTYTDNGKLESIEDAISNITEYEFDGFDRLKKKIYPDTTFEELTYNAGNLITNLLTRKGDDIAQTFDELNRLETRSPDSMPVVTFVYDLAGRIQTISTPTVANHPESGTFTFGYDTAGRLTSEQYPDSKTVSYTLDENGNVTRMDYPGSYYIERVFDELNRLTDIKLNGAGSPALELGYDSLSRRTDLTYENGASTSYGFQLDDDLEEIIQTFVGSSVTFGYTFNNIHQLTGQSVSDSTFMWHPASGGTTTYATANNLNQYPTVGGNSQTYNDNGCLIDDSVWDYGFDTVNKLISATDGGTSASYLYDPMGRQTQKEVNSTKTRFIYAGKQLIAEYDGSGNLLQRYVFGTGLDEPLIKITSGGTKTYMHHDRMGNIVAITDNAGAVANSYKYSPWGESSSMSGTIFGLQGQRYDAETGLYYMKARHYSPKTGRFLQPDPIGYADGLNIYQFAYNNPNTYRDPLGLAADKDPHLYGTGYGYGNNHQGYDGSNGYGNNHVGYDAGATYIGMDGGIRDSITGELITQLPIDPQTGLPYGYRPPLNGNPYPSTSQIIAQADIPEDKKGTVTEDEGTTYITPKLRQTKDGKLESWNGTEWVESGQLESPEQGVPTKDSQPPEPQEAVPGRMQGTPNTPGSFEGKPPYYTRDGKPPTGGEPVIDPNLGL